MNLMLIAVLFSTACLLAAALIWLSQALFARFGVALGQRVTQWLPPPLQRHLQLLLWPRSPTKCAQWMGIQVCALVVLLSALLFSLLWLAVAIFLVWMLQWVLLYQRQRRYQRQALAELPTNLDLLAMLLQSGSSLTAAIAAIAARPDGPLVLEFRTVHRGLQAGHTTASALSDLAVRLPLPEVKIVVATMLHAVKHGAVLAETLRFQAEQRRQEVLLRMEKQAQEAPVKLLFPLLTCFFPVSFMLLIGPMLLRFSME